MSEGPPVRRAFRFSLRTLLVLVTLVCIVLGVRFGWRPNWIIARREFLARQHTEWADAPPELRRGQNLGPPLVAPRAGYAIRFLLWFYGEVQEPQIRVPIRVGRRNAVDRSLLATDANVQTAATLFPEASIYAVHVLSLPDSLRRQRIMIPD